MGLLIVTKPLSSAIAATLKKAALAAILTVLTVQLGFAQSLPGGADAGRLQKNLSTPKLADPIASSPSAATQVAPATKAPAGAGKIAFILKTLKVEGVTAYPPGFLEKIASDRVGQRVTVQEVFDYASKMTATYRNDGYLLSRVVVPQQKIDSGNVLLRAVEGYIDDVVVEGVSSDLEKIIKGYVNKVIEARPLSRGILERYLLLAGDSPGLTIRSFLKPSKKNSAAATLMLTASKKASVFWSRLDNRGSEFVGPYQAEVGASYAGLPGGDQALSVRVLTTPLQNKELRYVNLQYQRLLGTEGTVLFASGNALTSEPGKSLKDLGLKSAAYGFEAGIKLVPIRRRDENFNFNISFSYSNTDTDALDVPFSQDRTRTLSIGGEYQFSDKFGGATSASIGGKRGLGWLGETPDGDGLSARADAVSDATWAILRASRLQGLDTIMPGLSVLANVSGQYSLDALSSSREFGVGGLANASAFDSSEISGDHGLSGRLELRYATALPMLDDIVPEGKLRQTSVQFYGFSDGGFVWQEDADVTGQQKDRIASAGLGARFNIGAHFSGSVEVAQPFAQPVSSKGSRDPRVFVQVVARF
jgi:hemolysin activation/secretion protein